jgi:DNA segregation ATPase FtsK/SpoIIIE-like protein
MSDDRRVFCGWALKRAHGPLVAVHDRAPAATWPWGTVPHALMIGTTGGGKTTLLRVMATSLVRTAARSDARHELSVILADGKGGDSFMMFDALAGVSTANGPAELAEAVAAVHGQMTGRFAQLAQARQRAAATRQAARFAPPPYLHLWVDEYLSGLMQLPERDRAATVGRLVDIGLRGREARVHLLLAMQRPDARAADTGLPGLLKAELKARIAAAGQMGMDGLEARMAFDDAAVAHRIRPGRGAGLLRVGRHEVGFQVPWMADPTDPAVKPEDRQAAWRLLPTPVSVEVSP